ncbi:MAG: type II toxin-antitoxin system VapC family toxin [Bacteroidetes bacterium]|nr:type II toxin-antitoxin system VapC family toxin [Bacteroidota bacterium]
MEKILIDTNILIGITRNQKAAEDALAKMDGSAYCICDVVLSEMLDGARNKAEHAMLLDELTSKFEVLPFTPEVSEHFRQILTHGAHERGSYLADRLIAATAMAHDCALLTLNKKHFKGIRGLKLA